MIENPTLFIAQRLKHKRLQMCLSISLLAEKIGVSTQQMRKYENGINQISNVKLYDIARYLNISMTYFFENLYNEVNLNQNIAASLSSLELSNLIKTYSAIDDLEIRKAIMRFMGTIAKSV